ncbi:hypothetical protein [Niabella ginsengisoli]|uniref:RagB/SusD family nutrient uptake outer membrane protein n=1 Tax=Niabella ginsengisoli TaxID=522298 RepID=A0ABS9SIZ4_9BACT|nr:hypothetical protein [Niabella ginsengisoli]MCH5598281.1 hypothetical protein [Niabella ginsengisoli]
MRIFSTILVFIVFLFGNCSKKLDLPSRHQVPENNMWLQRNDARSGVFATYGLTRAALANENAFLHMASFAQATLNLLDVRILPLLHHSNSRQIFPQ